MAIEHTVDSGAGRDKKSTLLMALKANTIMTETTRPCPDL